MAVTSKLPLNTSLQELILFVNRLLDGKLNSTGTATLTANTTTTTVADIRVGPNSTITFMATTVNAATEIATMYVSDITRQEFEITHANNANTDRTYKYSVLG